MVFQNYALYPHMDVTSNITLGLKLHNTPKQIITARLNEAADWLQLTPAAQALSPPAFRRPAAAGGAGPLGRARAEGLPDGRAAVESRCPAAGEHAHRADQAAPPARRDHRLCHPRPERGDDHGDPGGDHAQWRYPAARAAAGGLPAPGEQIRRHLHGQPGDELHRGHLRAARRSLEADQCNASSCRFPPSMARSWPRIQATTSGSVCARKRFRSPRPARTGTASRRWSM